MAKAFAAALLLALAGCAGYGGRGLIAGQAGEADVVAVMGAPALRWIDGDGTRRLAYPRGPMGTATYMVRVGADGKLSSIENALVTEVFARVRAGMSQEQVLHLLGPSEPSWTVHFPARDELAWEWRYCDDGNQYARFDVLFDATTRTVRSTLSLTESQVGNCGGPDGSCWCAH